MFPHKSIFDIDGENRIDSRYQGELELFFQDGSKILKNICFRIIHYFKMREKKRKSKNRTIRKWVFPNISKFKVNIENRIDTTSLH